MRYYSTSNLIRYDIHVVCTGKIQTVVNTQTQWLTLFEFLCVTRYYSTRYRLTDMTDYQTLPLNYYTTLHNNFLTLFWYFKYLNDNNFMIPILIMLFHYWLWSFCHIHSSVLTICPIRGAHYLNVVTIGTWPSDWGHCGNSRDRDWGFSFILCMYPRNRIQLQGWRIFHGGLVVML